MGYLGMVRGTVEVHRKLRRALPGLASPAGAGNSGLPISLRRIEATGDATGLLDVAPMGLRCDIRCDLASRGDRHITLRAGGPLLDRTDLTGA
jgi:hypothetical protein